MRNPVGISMKKDEIMIRISEKATHEETIECLNKKIPALKKLYKTEKTPICVTGKILKNREKDIMEMRFGFISGKEKTQKEVADELGISQSYISRLEKRILEKIKREFERVS